MSVAAQSQCHNTPSAKCLTLIEERLPFPCLHMKEGMSLGWRKEPAEQTK